MVKLLRVREVANITGENIMTIYTRIRNGELAPVRIGKRGIRVPESELQKWIAGNQKK